MQRVLSGLESNLTSAFSAWKLRYSYIYIYLEKQLKDINILLILSQSNQIIFVSDRTDRLTNLNMPFGKMHFTGHWL